jgi:serine/threonine-protein kinase
VTGQAVDEPAPPATMAAHLPEKREPSKTLAGRYRLEEKVGSGAMGDVWSAADMRINRQVAVKVLPRAYSEDSSHRQRFMREARLLASLEHPNIVKVFDLGFDDEGHPYLVMELLHGRNLGDVLDAEGALQPRKACAITAGLLSALSAAHRSGVVHRDVKPDNAILATSGATQIVKLLDFGISRSFLNNADRVTDSGLVLGTPYYMPPEQIYGQPLDERSDVFAVGSTFYELLTGRTPVLFVADESPVKLFERLLSEDPPAPSEVREGVPGMLDAIVLRALAKKREDRFANCEQMRKALIEALSVLTNEPVVSDVVSEDDTVVLGRLVDLLPEE